MQADLQMREVSMGLIISLLEEFQANSFFFMLVLCPVLASDQRYEIISCVCTEPVSSLSSDSPPLAILVG